MCGARPGVKRLEGFRARIVRDAVITTTSCRSCDSCCPAVLCSEMQPVGSEGWQGTEQTRSGAVLECTRNQWNPKVRLSAHHLLRGRSNPVWIC